MVRNDSIADAGVGNSGGQVKPAKRRCWERLRGRWFTVAAGFSLLASGCTTLREWWHNGLKVGPNYERPAAPVATSWIDGGDARVQSQSSYLCAWWSLFNDPALNSLIESAYRQNLDVKRAAYHILEARANCCMTAGNLLPQSQGAIGAYAHGQISKTLSQGAFNNLFDLWIQGGYISWELDVWGRLRRQLESARADYGAAIENYNDVVVILLADVATNYVQLRTYQQRLQFARQNVEIQQGSLDLAESRYREGTIDESDVQQARANLEETKATIPELEAGLRQANNRLCILLGEPTHDLVHSLEARPIPSAPPEVVVGVPAELLRRRPDVRRAERNVASQCAQIGYAESDLYPHFSILGFLGLSADEFKTLWNGASLTGFIVPNFQWKILNYGRLMNAVRIEDAKFHQRVLEYEQLTLRAGEEVENGIVSFLQSQDQARHLAASVQSFETLTGLVVNRYRGGTSDFNRVFTTQLSLVRQQDRLAVAQQDVALNLIKVYRALGGGWEVFQRPEGAECDPSLPTIQETHPVVPTPPVETLPAPAEAPSLK